ncbi:MAG: hypothetical protein AB1744_11080, partial [Candidatus Zixiibacteriota bacterium]
MSIGTETPAVRSLAGEAEERLVNLFFVLYRNARIVDRTNPAFGRQCRKFYEVLSLLLRQKTTLTLKLIAGRFFVDEKLARYDAEGASGSAPIIREWQAVGLAGVTFLEGITVEEIEELLVFLSGIRPRDDSIAGDSDALKELHLPSVRLLSAQELSDETPALTLEIRKQFRARARVTFFRVMSVVEDNMAAIARGKDIDVSRTKRIIRSLIDHILKDDQSLLELAAIKDFDDYTYAHSTNVCVYALTLGVRLELDRARLSQL